MDVVHALNLAGGVSTWAQLKTMGVSRRSLASAMHAGAIERIRRGCFALPHADPIRVAEVAWRGWATCVTAAARLQLPVPPDGRPHLGIVAGRSQSGRNLAVPPHVVTHALRHGGRPDIVEILSHASQCCDAIDALAMIDGALCAGYVTAGDLHALRVPAPLRRWIVRHASAGSQSPLETRAHVALVDARITHDQQVTIAGVGRVDILIDGQLIVELDGRSHHSREADFASDRLRDRNALILGFKTLRFTYQDLLAQEDFVAAVTAARCAPLRPLGVARPRA